MNAIRPSSLNAFIGQERVRACLDLAIEAAQQRGEQLDHVLLSGPPGLGKTTLAKIIAEETGGTLIETSAPSWESPADLAKAIASIGPGTIFFVDEIHGLKREIEETLYSAMEDGFLSITLSEGAKSTILRVPLPPFTLVGATTREGRISAPFRSRFPIRERLDLYSQADLAQIITNASASLEVEIDGESAMSLAARSRGTPRVGLTILRRTRDFAQLHFSGAITMPCVDQAMSMLGIDEHGLGKLDHRILAYLADNNLRPVGLKTLAAAINEEETTIEDTYEPWLIASGLLAKTPNGRALTPRGMAIAGIDGDIINAIEARSAPPAAVPLW